MWYHSSADKKPWRWQHMRAMVLTQKWAVTYRYSIFFRMSMRDRQTGSSDVLLCFLSAHSSSGSEPDSVFGQAAIGISTAPKHDGIMIRSRRREVAESPGPQLSNHPGFWVGAGPSWLDRPRARLLGNGLRCTELAGYKRSIWVSA